MDALNLNPQTPSPTLDIAFRSGMSRSKDLHAAIDANAAAGVVAGELMFLQKTITIPRYLQSGGAVFIDSGAFAELKTGIAPNFRAVLATYKQIAECAVDLGITPANLFVVAPDKVGDQWASIERLCQYEKEVRELIELGCNVIVPIQCGPIAPAELVTSISVILETKNFTVGVPSNAAAMSIEECATLVHDRFHILGRVQKNAEQVERIAALRSNLPTAMITADANWLRSRLDLIGEHADEIRASGKSVWSMREASVAAAIRADTTWAVA